MDFLSNAFNNIKNSSMHLFGNAAQAVGNEMQQLHNVVAPPPPLPPAQQSYPMPSFGQNLMGDFTRGIEFSPIGQGILGLQHFISSPQQFQPIPTLHPFSGNGLPQQIGNAAFNIPGSLVNTVVGQGVVDPALDAGRLIGSAISGQQLPQYDQLKSPAVRFGYNVGGMMNNTAQQQLHIQNTPQQFIGNIAGAANPALNAYSGGQVFGIGRAALAQAGEQGLKQAVIQGAKSGAIAGVTTGLSSGLAQGRNDTTLPQQLIEGGKEAAVGGATGAVFGGGLSGVTHIVGAVRDLFPNSSPEQQQVAAQSFLRDNQGKFTTQGAAPADIKQKVQNWVRETNGMNPSAVIYPSDLYKAIEKSGQKGFINFDAKIGKPRGDSTEELTPVLPQDKIPLNQAANEPTTGSVPGSVNRNVEQSSSTPSISLPVNRSAPKSTSTQPIIKQARPGDFSNTREADQLIAKKMQSKVKEPLPWETTPQMPGEKPLQLKATEKTPFVSRNTVTDSEGVPVAKFKQGPPSAGSNNPLNKVMNPLKNMSKDFQQAANEWDAGKKTARVEANQVNMRMRTAAFELGITPKQEDALMHYSQNPTPSTIKVLQDKGFEIDKALVKKAEPYLQLHADLEKERLIRANEQGIHTAELQNHLYQTYAGKPEEIKAKLEGMGLNRKPGFTLHREIPTYLDAQEKAGLLPKYTTLGQHNAEAEQALSNALANKKFHDYLLNSKNIVPASDAPRGFKPITSDYFPRSSNGEIYMAKPETADVINNMFGGNPQSPIQKGLKGFATLSGHAQANLLTTPGYAVHGFSIAQAVKDTTAGIGTVVSGHPITGMRMIATPIQALARAFVPGAAGKFERQFAPEIKEMAQHGIGYTGKFNYEDLQKNMEAPGKIGGIVGVYKKVEKAVVGSPTFEKFMFQRRVSLYKTFKDALTGRGLETGAAATQAAEQLKKYDGIVNEMGRSPDVKNFMKAFLFAPKYRESVMGSLVNTLKGTAQWSNKDYQYSRSLLMGMGLTYLAYNQLNKKLNGGKNIWDNPTGHQFDLVIPQKQDPTKYYAVPWMSGITTVPRSIVNTVIALAKGDTNTAAQQASGILSTPLQTLAQAGTGKDYFGRDIFDKAKPLLPQQLGYVAKNTLLPSSANEVGKYVADQYAGKNPSLAVTGARMIQLPLKEGTVPSPYFGAKDTGNAKLTQQQQKIADYFTTSSSNGGPSGTEKAQMMFNKSNNWLLDYQKGLRLASNPQDPLYSRPNNDIRAYLAYQQENDTALKAQIRLQNPWIPQVQYALEQQAQDIIRKNNASNVEANNNQKQSLEYGVRNALNIPQAPQKPLTPVPNVGASPLQQLSPEQVQVVSAYTASPKGSTARKQILSQNPWLPGYWNANTAFYQQNPIQNNDPLSQYLTSVGINPSTAQAGGSYGGFARKPSTFGIQTPTSMLNSAKRKLSIRMKPVRISSKIKKAKGSKLKLSKGKKLKLLTTSKKKLV